jgi:hypothetical protein
MFCECRFLQKSAFLCLVAKRFSSGSELSLWTKKMGSRKLILLPQVLPMLTFDSAYHVFPYMLHLALSNLSKLSFTLSSITLPGRAQPDIARHRVSLCPA